MTKFAKIMLFRLIQVALAFRVFQSPDVALYVNCTIFETTKLYCLNKYFGNVKIPLSTHCYIKTHHSGKWSAGSVT